MKSNNLKILYIVGPIVMSGAAISFKVILEGMIDLGCNVIVLVTSKEPENEFVNFLRSKKCIVEKFNDEMYIYPKVQVWRWENSFIKFPWRLSRKIFLLIKSNIQVYRLIKKHRPDIVHTNVGVFQQGLKACEKLKIPHIWHLREYQTKDFGWHIFPSMKNFKNQLKKSYVISITFDIMNYFNIQNQKSATYLWNGILSEKSITYKSEKKPFFLCANRISPEKNIEEAILAFASIASSIPGYSLLIVGKIQNKVYLEKLNQLIEDVACTNRIRIHDHRSDITDLMKEAVATVVTSNFEGLGRMSLEATFMGCLVIGRNTGGTKEIINTTKGGYLFNTREELSKYFIYITKIVGTKEYENKIYNAQKVAINKSSNEQYCKIIYNIYNTIINNKRSNINKRFVIKSKLM